jgi:hypothetical protein
MKDKEALVPINTEMDADDDLLIVELDDRLELSMMVLLISQCTGNNMQCNLSACNSTC